LGLENKFHLEGKR